MADQRTLPPTSSTSGLFSYTDALGIDPNALADAAAYADSRPIAALEACTRARHALDVLEANAVTLLRREGATWADVGHHLGITMQAAHKRFRHLDA